MTPWHGRREVRGIPILDLALAAVLLFTSLGAILTGEVHEGAETVTIPVAIISSLAMVLRTRATIVATFVVCAAQLFQALLGSNYPGTIMALAIMLILSYSLAAERDEGPAAAGLALLLLTSFFEEWHQGGVTTRFWPSSSVGCGCSGVPHAACAPGRRMRSSINLTWRS